MFDRDGSSTIDFQEFRALWKYVSDWEKCFRFVFCQNKQKITENSNVLL